MRIAINTDSHGVLITPAPLMFKGGSLEPLILSFASSGVTAPIQLGADVTIEFGMTSGDSIVLAYATNFQRVNGNLYQAEVSFSGQTLLGLLSATPLPVDCEICWGSADKKYRSVTFKASVERAVIPDAIVPEPDPEIYVSTSNLQAALALKAPLASPAFTGIPTAPTPSAGTSSNQIATAAFVKIAIDNLIAGAPGALDTLKEIADQLADDESSVAALVNTIAGVQAAALQKIANLNDLADKAVAFSAIKQDATQLVSGVVQLATTSEANAGVDQAKALTASVVKAMTMIPAGVQSELNLKLPLSGGTLTGNLVGNGSGNRLPNQLSATDDAVMTRKLASSELWQNTPMPFGWHPTAYASGASVTVSGPSCVIYMVGGGAVGAYGAVKPLGDSPIYRSGSGYPPAFGTNFSLLIDVQQNALTSDGSAELRLFFGVDAGAVALTNKGLGVVFQNHTTANLIAHDGVSLQTAACTISSFNIDNLCRFLITWDGISLKLYQTAWSGGVAPRWSLKGTLTTTGLSGTMAGNAWMLALVRTIAGPQSFTTNVRSSMYSPSAVVP